MPPEPPLHYKIDLLIEHLRTSVAYKGEHRAMLEIRRFYSTYLKGLPHIAEFRSELMQYNYLQPVLDKLKGLFDQILD